MATSEPNDLKPAIAASSTLPTDSMSSTLISALVNPQPAQPTAAQLSTGFNPSNLHPTFQIGNEVQFNLGFYSLTLNAGLSWTFSDDLKSLVPTFDLGINMGLTTETPAGVESGWNYQIGASYDMPSLQGVVVPNPPGVNYVDGTGWGLELGGSVYVPVPEFPLNVDFAIGGNLSAPTSASGIPSIGIGGSVNAGLAIEDPAEIFNLYGNITSSVSFSLYDIGQDAINAIIKLGSDGVDEVKKLAPEVIDAIGKGLSADVIDKIRSIDGTAVQAIHDLDNATLGAISSLSKESIQALYKLDPASLATLRQLVTNITTSEFDFKLRDLTNDSLNQIHNLGNIVIRDIRNVTAPTFDLITNSIGSLTKSAYDYIADHAGVADKIRSFGQSLLNLMPSGFAGLSANTATLPIQSGAFGNSLGSLGFPSFFDLLNLASNLTKAGLKYGDVKSIIDLSNDAFNRLKNSGSYVISEIRGLSGDAYNAINSLQPDILSDVRHFTDSSIGMIENNLDQLKNLKQLGDEPFVAAQLFSKEVDAIRQISPNAIDTVIDTVKNPSLSNVVNTIHTLSPDYLNGLYNWSPTLLDQFRKVGDPLRQELVSFGGPVVDTVRHTADTVIQDLINLGGIGKSIYDLLKNGAHAGLDQVAAIQTQLDGFLADLPNKLLSLSGNHLNEFLDKLPPFPANLDLQTFASTLTQNLPDPIKSLQLPSTNLTGNTHLLGKLSPDIGNSFFNLLPSNFIQQFADKLPANFFDTLRTVVNNFIGDVPDPIKNFFPADGHTLPGQLPSDLLSVLPGNLADSVPAAVRDDLTRVMAKQGSSNGIQGTANDDILNGTDANNLILGGAGNDVINAKGGDDWVFGNDGNDTINGGLGNDTIVGGAGNDLLTGGGGNDQFVIRRGDGTDTITDFRGFGRGSTPSSNAIPEADVLKFEGAGLTARNMILTQEGQDLAITFDGVNDTKVILNSFNLEDIEDFPTQFGNQGVGNILFDGQTTIRDSFDVMNADAQPNSVFNPNTVTFLNDLNNTVQGFDNSDDVINGMGGDDLLRGLGGNDLLRGGSGNDTLDGGAGDDTLDGGTGADRLLGGTGNDVYIVDNVGDQVIEGVNEGTDLVKSSIDYTLTANVENLTLTGTAIRGTGNELANVITGNAGNNLLQGLAGNDTLMGGAGDDTLDGGLGDDLMIGGTGNDTYIVDSPGDKITEAANEGVDLVKSSISYALGDNLENLTLTGTSNINGAGNALNNVITGNDGANLLEGMEGNDTLIGGAGNDTLIGSRAALGYTSRPFSSIPIPTGQYSNEMDVLTGGTGSDRFVLGNNAGSFYMGSGSAVITDFNAAEGDQIQLHRPEVFRSFFGGTITQIPLRFDNSKNLVGGAANDTAIYYNNDLIGIVQDVANLSPNSVSYV